MSQPSYPHASCRESVALRVARRAVQAAGFDTDRLRVLRVASSVLVEFPTAELVARVDPPGHASRVRDQVVVARFLEDRGVPAVRTLDTPTSVFVTPEGVVSLWHRVVFEERCVTPEELGGLLCSLHKLTRDGGEQLPRLDPLGGVEEWLQSPRVQEAERERELTARIARLREDWAGRAPDPWGEAVIHGDLNLDNVLVTPAGPVLMDLETSGVGPVGWDLAAQWVAVRRYGNPMSDYMRFSGAYGADVRESPAVALYTSLYEGSLTVWCLAHADVSAAMTVEADLRLRSFLDGSHESWTLR